MKKLAEMTLEELWHLFPIRLEEYNADYPALYKAESAAVEAAVGSENIFRISHIGSTSVYGLKAKPIIDILLEVVTAAALENAAHDLPAFGWIVMNEIKAAGRISLVNGYTESGFADKVFHLHIRLPGDCDELYFRDYLRVHHDVADAYAALKTSLAEKHRFNRDAYTDAKTDFVKAAVAEAKREFGLKYRP